MNTRFRQFVLPFALAVCAVVATASASAAAQDGLVLPEVRTGEAVDIGSGGRLTHVVFFATWCPPCLEELAGLGELEARWSDGGYRLLLVAVENRHTEDRLRRFVERRSPPGRVLFDRQGQVQQRLKVDQIPTHLLIDSSGEVLQRSGSLDREIRERIEAALGDSLRPRRR